MADDDKFLEFLAQLINLKPCDCGKGRWAIVSPTSPFGEQREGIVGFPVFTLKGEMKLDPTERITPTLMILCTNCGYERFYKLTVIQEKYKEYCKNALEKKEKEGDNG
jgi:hypothetical protein